jgi:polysaccharide biosynthesis/export protein
MQGARAAISCLLAALALPGCMPATAPIATVQPRNDLDGTSLGPGEERWF